MGWFDIFILGFRFGSGLVQFFISGLILYFDFGSVFFCVSISMRVSVLGVVCNFWSDFGCGLDTGYLFWC